MRHACSYTSFIPALSAVIAVGCADFGGESDAPDSPGAAIELHLNGARPECYTERTLAPVPTTSETLPLLLARQNISFRASTSLYKAQMLARPIVEDPTASEWALELESGDALSRIEGEILAAGDDWTVIAMFWIVERNGEPQRTISATIEQSATRTLFDFGDESIELGRTYYRFGQFAQGCDDESGVSFEVAPQAIFEGIPVWGVQCWPSWVETDIRPAGLTAGSGGGSGGSLSIPGRRPGLDTNLGTSCADVINRVLVW
jgi:hypothetical protein